MKYLVTFAAMLLLALALAARQGTPSIKPDDSEKGRPAAGQASSGTSIDKAATSDNPNASEQNAQSEVKAANRGKLSLDLGSMPCPLDDQECRANEKKRLEAPQEHP